MRQPRDIHNYVSAEQAAADLHSIADRLQANAQPGDKIKFHIRISFWNWAWKQPGKDRGEVTGVEMGNRR